MEIEAGKDLIDFARSHQKMPLSHQRMTAHLMSQHGEDIFKMVLGLFKDFESAEVKDRVKIAQILFPYFFIKADLAVNINMMESMNKEIHNVGGFNTVQLKKLEQFILDLREEASNLNG
jgi:hypothetical protein